MRHFSSYSQRIRNSQAMGQGFSLLEILIAIALIAGIAALLITNLDSILGGGNEKITNVFVNETLETPLMKYRIDMGNYPSTELGLQALVKAPTDNAANWKGPYVNSIPNDPWGKPYQYRFPGTHNPTKYDLWSYGPDGTESGDDIGNWKPATDNN